MLSSAAIASLAEPSAVSSRFQPHWSQAFEPAGSRWPQFGHNIASAVWVEGASVYSIESNKTHKEMRQRQANSLPNFCRLGKVVV